MLQLRLKLAVSMIRRHDSPTSVSTPSTDSKMSADQAIGILSRTINTSPTIRWILPARLRSERHNDVVFVGENAIELREFLPDGQMADAIARYDVGAQIVAAKVLSPKVKEISILDQIIKQDQDEDPSMLSGHPSQPSPHELLVITTAAGEVIFLYVANLVQGKVDFIHARKGCFADVSLLEKYGNHLAIDPEYVRLFSLDIDADDSRSRAMAIAPAYGFCGLFSLKPISSIQKEIERWNSSQKLSFMPASEVYQV